MSTFLVVNNSSYACQTSAKMPYLQVDNEYLQLRTASTGTYTREITSVVTEWSGTTTSEGGEPTQTESTTFTASAEMNYRVTYTQNEQEQWVSTSSERTALMQLTMPRLYESCTYTFEVANVPSFLHKSSVSGIGTYAPITISDLYLLSTGGESSTVSPRFLLTESDSSSSSTMSILSYKDNIFSTTESTSESINNGYKSYTKLNTNYGEVVVTRGVPSSTVTLTYTSSESNQTCSESYTESYARTVTRDYSTAKLSVINSSRTWIVVENAIHTETYTTETESTLYSGSVTSSVSEYNTGTFEAVRGTFNSKGGSSVYNSRFTHSSQYFINYRFLPNSVVLDASYYVTYYNSSGRILTSDSRYDYISDANPYAYNAQSSATGQGENPHSTGVASIAWYAMSMKGTPYDNLRRNPVIFTVEIGSVVSSTYRTYTSSGQYRESYTYRRSAYEASASYYLIQYDVATTTSSTAKDIEHGITNSYTASVTQTLTRTVTESEDPVDPITPEPEPEPIEEG